MTTILEPNVLLLAGLDDIEFQPEGIADRIFYAVANFNQRNLPVVSNYFGSVEGLVDQFRNVSPSPPDLRRVLSSIHRSEDLDPDNLAGIIENSALKEKQKVMIKVGGVSFRYDKRWSGHPLLSIPPRHDPSRYDVFDSCVAEICVRAVNGYSYYVTGPRRLPPIHLFVDPQLTDRPSKGTVDASAVYEFVAQAGLEKVFYKHTDHRFAF